MVQIVGKPFTQLTNLNILDELRIQGVLVSPGTGAQTIIETSGNYNVSVDDDFVADTGPGTITLPLSSNAFKSVTIKSVLGGGTLVLTPTGLDTIDGNNTINVLVNTAVTLWPVSAGWLIA